MKTLSYSPDRIKFQVPHHSYAMLHCPTN